ncbi:hypothetical protein [Desulfosporosinus fructosivorans]
MEKVLIAKSNRSLLLSKDMENDNINVQNMFNDFSIITKWIVEICLVFKVPMLECLFNKKLKNTNEKTIIVFDGHARIQFLRWIRKNNPNARIILWYWNTIEEIGKNIPINKVPASIEKWSYSKHDCEKYSLKYNTTFYSPHYKIKSYNPQRDIFFVGKDKNRVEYLLTLKNRFEELGLSTYFRIVPTHKYDLKISHVYSKGIPYKTVLEEISKSRAVLDCSVSKTSGPSIRPLEAIYHKRKLITDDLKITNCDYYNSGNIFIIGKDDFKELPNFINSSYIDIDPKTVEKYSLKAWIGRFFSIKEEN